MLGMNIIVMILILIGALNWGLVGFFDYNFVSVIFGGSAEGTYSVFDRIVFAIIGLAGLWGLSFLGRISALTYRSGKGGCCGSDSCDKDGKSE